MKEQEESGGWLGYFVALAAGVGIGMLLAPRPGKETRKKIGDWLDEHEGESGFIGKLASLRHPRITTAHHNGKQLKRW